MAVAGYEFTVAAPEPTSTFTMSIGGPEWKPQGKPCAGDLVVFSVLKPAVAMDQVTDSGGGALTAAGEDGRTWWCVMGPLVPESVTFHARNAGEWEVQGWVVAAGSYEPPTKAIPFGMFERSDGRIQ